MADITFPALEALEIEMSPLPPTDHGKEAYLVLTGCTLIQIPVWGMPLLCMS